MAIKRHTAFSVSKIARNLSGDQLEQLAWLMKRREVVTRFREGMTLEKIKERLNDRSVSQWFVEDCLRGAIG